MLRRGSWGLSDAIARTGAGLPAPVIHEEPENWRHQNASKLILDQRDSSTRPLGLGPPRVEAESGGGRAGGGGGGVSGPAGGGRTTVARSRGAGALRPTARRPGGRTMEPGTEEYELNGDLRPGSPGSPDASVRPQHPLPRPLCDLGWRRPLWARLSSGHLWVSGPVRAASALRGGGGGRCPRAESCLI